MTDQLPDESYFGVPSSDRPVVHIVEGVIVRPGDTLLLEVPDEITVEGAETLKAHVLALLPDLADVLVVSGVRVAVYRPDDAPA